MLSRNHLWLRGLNKAGAHLDGQIKRSRALRRVATLVRPWAHSSLPPFCGYVVDESVADTEWLRVNAERGALFASAVAGMMIKLAYNKGRIIDQFHPALSACCRKKFFNPIVTH